MDSFSDLMFIYSRELKNGVIQQAYKGLMDYISSLRTFIQKNYPGFDVPSNIYQGYMDMTYFSIIPAALKPRKLKIAVVFVYDSFRFEVWLSGYNRQVQAKYWQALQNCGLVQYRLVEDPLKADSILEHILVEDPNFDDMDELTRQITEGVLAFIADIESFLDRYDK